PISRVAHRAAICSHSVRQDFHRVSGQVHPLFDDGDEYVDGDADPDSCLHDVLGMRPDTEMNTTVASSTVPMETDVTNAITQPARSGWLGSRTWPQIASRSRQGPLPPSIRPCRESTGCDLLRRKRPAPKRGRHGSWPPGRKY